ncbi:radical SAM protein [Actinoallomurus rhizosphaericola]|uniref:radical SAM protein n=1 Tax=Actinoallomurus rhizosphaericola TaxID=2952536 RepID=UPI002091287A|nr:radical SAM protein [Actinoallomurus rhizosphaericola]MCO5994476.1 radical SAM protein [Actinoallomurus rhizosphaericola]
MNLDLLWLEITGRCQLACTHCYADSSPRGTHGTMTTSEWYQVIDQAAEIGVRTIQFIGGEPTLHPDFARLIEQAAGTGLNVEIFSNLVSIKAAWWDLFTSTRVSLATSYYAAGPTGHEAITQRRGSHARTRANIAEAVRRSIPLRVGIIDVGDARRAAEAEADLRSLGVTSIGTDRLRGIGRRAPAGMLPTPAELCGHCGRGLAAITPEGDVHPCVMSRWMSAGNVKERTLAEILTGPAMRELVESIAAPRAGRRGPFQPDQPPKPCGPDKAGCRPKVDGGDCHPAEKPACNPAYK